VPERKHALAQKSVKNVKTDRLLGHSLLSLKNIYQLPIEFLLSPRFPLAQSTRIISTNLVALRKALVSGWGTQEENQDKAFKDQDEIG